MFIAHLPAGYLLSTFLTRHKRWLIVGSVLPDLDLILVYGAGIAKHHHSFLSHKPALWLSALILTWMLGAKPMNALTLGALLHLVPDSWTGRVDWGWPLFPWSVTLIEVPARYDRWIWNFLFQPSFVLELAIVGAALWTMRLKRIAPSQRKTPQR